jgi:hypothetical protein
VFVCQSEGFVYGFGSQPRLAGTNNIKRKANCLSQTRSRNDEIDRMIYFLYQKSRSTLSQETIYENVCMK